MAIKSETQTIEAIDAAIVHRTTATTSFAFMLILSEVSTVAEFDEMGPDVADTARRYHAKAVLTVFDTHRSSHQVCKL